jgi:hypothetical protein
MPKHAPLVPPLEGWQRCMVIELRNPGRMIEDYTVRFDIPRAEGMLPDCRDLRFTDAVGELPFWIEKPGDDEVRAWVRFGRIAPGETKILLSYDNPTAARASDGEAAFLFFDDFESGFDPDKWRRSRDASRRGVGAFVQDGVMHVRGGDNHGPGWLRSVDLPNRVAIESRFKVERKTNHCVGGLRLQGQEKLSVGIDYNFYDYKPDRVTSGNRDSFAIHFHAFPNAEKAGVKLPGFWRNVWFTQRLSYDGSSASRNLVYARDKGEGDGPERIAADVPQTRSPVRINIEPWGWSRSPVQLFEVDWIAARNYAPVRLEVTVSRPGGDEVCRFVFDDKPPEGENVHVDDDDDAPDPWPEDGDEVF